MTRSIVTLIVTSVAMTLCSAGDPVVFPDVGQSLSLDAGDVSLNTGLLLPDGDDPFPAVVGLVGPGGYTYRDAWIEGHWPFWRKLSDALIEQRIALLLLDKRGVRSTAAALRRLRTHTIPGANHAFLYGEPCQPLKGHDGPPAFKSALLNSEFFLSIGIPLVE